MRPRRPRAAGRWSRRRWRSGSPAAAPGRIAGGSALRLALVAALLAAGLLVALSPAGAWIGDRFDDEPEKSAPAFAGAAQGRLGARDLCAGAYAIHPDGSYQGLGSFSEAGWSPHGEHVVGVDGSRLMAVDSVGHRQVDTGAPRRARPGLEHGLGFAVAYLQGPALRVVDGATGRHRPGKPPRRGPVTPAWRPRSDSVLTYAATAGRSRRWTSRPSARLWAGAPRRGAARARVVARRRRLVALSSHSVTVSGSSRSVLRRSRCPASRASWRCTPPAGARRWSSEAARARRPADRRQAAPALPGRRGRPRLVARTAAGCCSGRAAPTSGCCSARATASARSTG